LPKPKKAAQPVLSRLSAAVQIDNGAQKPYVQKEKFTAKLYISASLIESLNRICALNMGDKTQIQIYLRK